MQHIRIVLLLVAGILFGFISAVAQDNDSQSGFGRIQGTITDASSGNTLIGANVLLEGTSLGGATDIDGEYTINRVPAGTYTVRVSSIGYRSVDTTLTVPGGETVEYSTALIPQAVEGEEVVVSAQAEGQRQAINEQLSSKTIKNIVAKEKIRELPDESAAAALSRLPGVSLQEGDKVVVRGIQAKMNTVMVNGVQLPSTDVNDRSTNLGFISSNMLSGIEVTKAVTPDMDANSIGGVVNLQLQEAPDGFHYDVLTQGWYNTQDFTTDNYQVWASASNRFFDGKLGAFFQVNARRENGGQDASQANYNFIYDGAQLPPVGQVKLGMESFLYSDQVRITEERGGSLIMDYRLPNGKLVMQNTYAFTDQNSATHRNVLLFNPEGREYEIHRDIHDKTLIVNALQGEHDFESFSIDYGASHAFSEKATDLRYGERYGFGFENPLGENPYNREFSRDDRLSMTPDDVYNLTLKESDAEQAEFIQNGATLDQDFTERLVTGNLNVTVPMTFTQSITADFKFGGSLRQAKRENDIEQIFGRITENPGQANELAADWMQAHGMNPAEVIKFADFKNYDYGGDRGSNFLSGSFDMEQVLDTDLMDQYVRLARPAWGRHIAESRASDYTGTETLTAGYGMLDINLGPKLQLMGGLRYENNHRDYEADLVLQTHGTDGTAVIPNESEDAEVRALADSLSTVDTSIDHWFPNIQLRYSMTEWMDVRLAYTKTLSRPDYNAVVPNIYVESSASGQAGNPNLKPSVSDNYDAYVSVYSNKIGLFTVGAFYKKIENVFYQDSWFYRTLPENSVYPDSTHFDRLGYQYTQGTAPITTYFNNSNAAHLKGFELEWQTHFWYLPKPLNAMVLNVNYTRTYSEMAYDQTVYDLVEDCSGRFCIDKPVQKDTVRKARLLHQGDHIINVALGADYKGFSGRISFRMQGDVITNVAQRPEEDAFTGNIYNWDFSIRQKLPVDGLSLFLNGINVFHTPIKDYQEFKRADDGEVLRNLRRTSYNPRRFQLGIRYSY